MTNDPAGPASPAPSPRSAPTGGRTGRLLLLVAAAVVGGVAAFAGGAYLLLTTFNPVGDEWQCADGELPAVHGSGGRACFAEGSELPEGYRWDPWGNRPLASSCDEDDWVPVTHPRQGDDCVRQGTGLPAGWSRVTEG